MTPAQRHKMLAAAAGCVLGNRGLHRCEDNPVQKKGGPALHHVIRSPFAVVGLCWGGHQGPAGLHGMGPKAFCRLFRPPGETEMGLLVWANEDIAKLRP